MNSTCPPQAAGRRSLALLAGLALASTSVQAQTAPNPSTTTPTPTAADIPVERKDDDAVVLNPFEVSTSQDRGYAAGNTLSGSRADTPLAITPASISVMTKQFLDDFAITDMNEAAAWTINMDPPTGGESGPFGGNRFQASFRGAGNGSNFPSRNGALQYFIADSYNSERFEFSRGPSTSLFGDGGPGGIQSSTSKRGRFNAISTSTQFRVDSYGGYRTTLDHNFGRDRWALRVNGLHQNTKGYQDGTENKQNAISLAGSLKLTEKLVLRAEYERSAEWNIQYRKTYNEQASIWNRTTVNNDNSVIANPANFGLGQISATNDYLIYNYGTDKLYNYKTTQYQTVGLGYAIPWEGRSDLPNFAPGPSKEFNLGPADSIADRDLNARAVYLEHRVTPDLFLELAYIASDVDPTTRNMNGQPSDYRIDVNRLLPDNTTNPNFGKVYSDSGAQAIQYQQDSVKEYRGTASYLFKVPSWFEMTQRLNFNGGWRRGTFEMYERSVRWANNPLQADLRNNVNQVRYRIYWDDVRPELAPVLPPTSFSNQFATTPQFREVPVNLGSQARRSRTLTYGQLVSQTTFLNERIGFTGSFRRDQIRLKGMEGVAWDADGNAIQGNAGVAGVEGRRKLYQNSQSAGIVAYPFPDKWPLLKPLGFVANTSSNFEQVARSTNRLITGEDPPITRARTKDLGLRYSMPNGVAYGTVLYYDTKQSNILSGFGSAADFRNIYKNLGYTEPELAGDSAFGNYQDTSDRALKGWEVELVANPLRNLTFMINYAHPIVKIISESNGRRAYFAAHEAEFREGGNRATGDNFNGRIIQDPAVIRQALTNIENSLNGTTAGTLQNGLERHRINVAGSYRFTEGKLQGFAFTGGVNYRGYRKAGARDARIKFGLADSVTPTAEQNVAAAYDYLWVKPTWQVTAGVNYTKRFEKFTARVQLNVTNLLDEDSPQWGGVGSASAYGVIAQNALLNGNPRMQVLSAFQQADPRKFTLTTTFDF